MAEPIVNPEIPFVGDIPGGLQPGKMIRFQGVTHPDSDRFNINLATGPNAKPRDDTALHMSVRLNQGYVARNTYKDGGWGDEQGKGKLPIGTAQSFEIIILVDPSHYKVAVNGQHFCEFPHRIPFQDVSHLLVDGDVSVTLISFEGIAIPGGLTAMQASQVNAASPQGAPQFGGPQYGPLQGGYGAPPPNYGGYGPPPPPGAEPETEFGGFMEKAQDILAGAIKSGAAEKLLGSILHSGGGQQQQQQQQGYAPQNARYGIYPDLPTQDTAAIPQNTGTPGQQDSELSGLIAGSGGTITSGPQPVPQSGGYFPPGYQNMPAGAPPGAPQPGPLEGLLAGLLGGKDAQGGNNQMGGGASGPQNTQSGGSDLLSGILSSLISGSKQNDQPGAQNPPPNAQTEPQNSQGGGSSQLLSGILQGLLGDNKNHPALGAQNQPQNPPPSQNQGGGDALSSLLQGLLSSGNSQQAPGGANVPPGGANVPPGGANVPPQSQGPNAAKQGEFLTYLLQGLLSKAKEQHDDTRPVEETRPSEDGLHNPGREQEQQYGQYPHPPQQEQRGPMESLLSGLLSGGGQQQQQPHVPQVGGEGSVGGLGSMGGILGSLAGSFLHGPDQNQRH